MSTVHNHAAVTPTTTMQSSHDCGVGSGSLACQRSNAYAAATETQSCVASIHPIRMAGA